MPVLPDIPKAEIAIVELANAFRATQKLSAVKSNPALAHAARDFATFLAASPIFSHEADGRRPADRIKAAGYHACSSAENLAWISDSRGFETRDLANRLVEGWKGSPPHRKNLELPHVSETGAAIAKVRGQQKYMAVQLFGRPASLRYTFEIENLAGRGIDYAAFGKTLRIEPDTKVQHTACEPGEVTFQLAAGGLLSKPASARFDAKAGHIFRLTRSPAGAVGVEVHSKSRPP